MVFSGDFRQVLPVIPKASRTEIVNSSIKRSYLWQHFTVMKLHQNMRLRQDGCAPEQRQKIEQFSNWILDIGDADPIAAIANSTYDNIVQYYGDQNYFADRAVVAPFHDNVSLVNDYMLQLFPGEEVCYHSSDSIQFDAIDQIDTDAEFPPEFLNNLKIGNFPDHELKLKVGIPVILLRNIDQAAGLCNGTRLIIRTMGKWSIEVEIVTGTNVGDRVYLPRMQYPIALCFAMTINKSQGQTLKKVGICLTRQVFTHGELYVALSRVTTKASLQIISCDEAGSEKNSMKNIVFREILN
ncbi:ATP-dependent DNA helicase PIF1 [Linum grandiflorum]